jgi:esterase/lipase
VQHRFQSGPFRLNAHLAHPHPRSGPRPPAVLLCHGFPSAVTGAKNASRTLPELADRIATELGWLAMAPTFRGAGESEGSFSLRAWLDDVSAGVAELAGMDADGISVVGFGTGGALAVCAAVKDTRVDGVAVLGSPADFDDWASQPRRLLDHARAIGLITEESFPSSFERWSRELREIRAVQCAARLAPRPLLVVHGTEDDLVPDFDARVVADAHGQADLRIIGGAGHQLRHDPRAVALLFGWLDRQRTQRSVP